MFQPRAVCKFRGDFFVCFSPDLIYSENPVAFSVKHQIPLKKSSQSKPKTKKPQLDFQNFMSYQGSSSTKLKVCEVITTCVLTVSCLLAGWAQAPGMAWALYHKHRPQKPALFSSSAAPAPIRVHTQTDWQTFKGVCAHMYTHTRLIRIYKINLIAFIAQRRASMELADLWRWSIMSTKGESPSIYKAPLNGYTNNINLSFRRKSWYGISSGSLIGLHEMLTSGFGEVSPREQKIGRWKMLVSHTDLSSVLGGAVLRV